MFLDGGKNSVSSRVKNMTALGGNLGWNRSAIKRIVIALGAFVAVI